MMEHPGGEPVTRAKWTIGSSLLLMTLSACGGAHTRPANHSQDESVVAPAPEVALLWQRSGNADLAFDAAIGERTVFVNLSRRLESGAFQEVLYGIDRATGQERALAINGDLGLVRVDPLIVNHWDGQRARWLGTHLVGLSDTFEPSWQSGRMNFSPPRFWTGPLVLVEQSQMGEHVGLNPETGAVTLRLRGDPDGVFGGGVEAVSFVAVPTEERAILVDLATGEVSGVVDAELGNWVVVRDRLVTMREGRLVAYDGRGEEAWSRPGELASADRGATLGERLVPRNRVFAWQGERGLVAFDADGEERWVHEGLNADDCDFVIRHEDDLFVYGVERLFLVLDANTGATAYACATPDCQIERVLDDSALVRTSQDDGSFTLTLHGRDGEVRWRHTPEAVRTSQDELRLPSIAVTDDHIVTCAPQGPVRFLDRADGAVVFEHTLAIAPPSGAASDQGESRPRCYFRAGDQFLLVANERGVALFGPPEVARNTPAPIETTLSTLPPPEPRAFYVLAAQEPPAEGQPSEAYTHGRALYRQAREAFDAGRFADAASGLVEAYRAFFAASDGAVKQLGLECCYDVRVSLDHAGDEALRESVMGELTGDDDDERCRNIIERAPEPSVPF